MRGFFASQSTETPKIDSKKNLHRKVPQNKNSQTPQNKNMSEPEPENTLIVSYKSQKLFKLPTNLPPGWGTFKTGYGDVTTVMFSGPQSSTGDAVKILATHFSKEIHGEIHLYTLDDEETLLERF